MRHPIYIVVSERMHGGAELNWRYGLPNIIIDVIECDVSEIDRIWNDGLGALVSNHDGRNIQVAYYTRESDSPFRQWANRPAEVEQTVNKA